MDDVIQDWMIDVPSLSILAKTGRAQILNHLLAHPSRSFTISGLAKEARVPFATTWRSVQDLRGLGLALTGTFGKATAVRLNRRSPATRAFGKLEFPDPHRMAFKAFEAAVKRRLANVSVLLFGSVARGRATPLSDVDAAVAYGSTGYSRSAVVDACADASNDVLDTFNVVVSPFLVHKLSEVPP